jgi:acetolactate synthase-1/2/3 large subunit
MNISPGHYCHQGFSPDPYIQESDLIIVIDCDVPWYPSVNKPDDSTTIVNIGIDPLYSNYPIRTFKSDITVNSSPDMAMEAISEELTSNKLINKEKLAIRNKQLKEKHDQLFSDLKSGAEKGSSKIPLSQAYISSRVNRVIDGNTINVNEYNNQMIWQGNHAAGRFFGEPHAGYLGWGVGAALGVKMGSPDKTVIATVGDGSYMFAVPSACHFVSSTYELPILVIVYNNRSWNAVKHAVLDMHPEGWASKSNDIPLGELKPSPDYDQICTAFGGYGEKVEKPGDIDGALKRALNVVKNEKRQACLNIICK